MSDIGGHCQWIRTVHIPDLQRDNCDFFPDIHQYQGSSTHHQSNIQSMRKYIYLMGFLIKRDTNAFQMKTQLMIRDHETCVF